jgi:hypothetical protein
MSLFKNRIVMVTCLGTLLVFSSGSGQEGESEGAFSGLKIPRYRAELPLSFAGEKLFYEIRWGRIRAAEAELETEYALNSRDIYHVRAMSRTTGMARKLWRMDDWAEIFMDAKRLRPQEYRLYVREIFAHLDMNATFNEEQTQVRVMRVSRENKKERQFLCHYAYDPGSAAFLIRSLEWKPGQVRWFEIVDGNERHLLIIEAIAEEKVAVQAGLFYAVKLAPILIKLPKYTTREDEQLMDRIHKKEKETDVADEVFVWIAREGTRPIVKTWAKAFIGHVELELVRMESP